MKKVRVVREPAFVDRYPVAMPTRITVRTREGKSYTKQKDVPLGHPGNPMSDQELEVKFRRLVARRLGQTRTERLIRLIWQMDTMKDISALMPLLRTNS
jgi:2-methylcitrate dehydratase